MMPGAPIYVAHSDTRGITFRRSFLEAGFKLSSCLILRKNALSKGRLYRGDGPPDSPGPWRCGVAPHATELQEPSGPLQGSAGVAAPVDRFPENCYKLDIDA